MTVLLTLILKQDYGYGFSVLVTMMTLSGVFVVTQKLTMAGTLKYPRLVSCSFVIV